MTLAPEDATRAAHAAFGRHPGFRALHAKGTLLSGTFTATPQAAELSRAAHLQGEPVALTARLSNGAGNPRLPDSAPDVRGLAVKFYLPDGTRADIVAQTAPRFPVPTPEAFVELLEVLGSGPRMVVRMPAFLIRHPGAGPRLARSAGALRPPVSYAACRYFAVHAYRFLDAAGGSRYVRYLIEPERVEPRLWPHQARGRDHDYLQKEIRERVARGPVRFHLDAQIADPGDPVDDPSAHWPDSRQRVRLGTLELSGLETGREQDGDVLVFDPTRVTDGIELSADPVLRYRPAAYSASVAERSAVEP